MSERTRDSHVTQPPWRWPDSSVLWAGRRREFVVVADASGERLAAELAPVGDVGPTATTAQVRALALIPVAHRGRLRPEVWDAFQSAHRTP